MSSVVNRELKGSINSISASAAARTLVSFVISPHVHSHSVQRKLGLGGHQDQNPTFLESGEHSSSLEAKESS